MTKVKENLYQTSWIDKYFNWVKKLPVPIWMTYLILFILCIAFVSPVYVQAGRIKKGFGIENILVLALWLPAILAALHWMNIAARKAMMEFQQMTQMDSEIFGDFIFRMTSIPRRVVWTVHVVIGGSILLVVLKAPIILGPEFTNPFLTVYIVIVFSLVILIAYHTVRQLKSVNQAYKTVRGLNIFHLQSLYSLSEFTAKLGVMWVLIPSLNFLINYILKIGPLAIPLLGLFELVLAAMVFLLPLWGVHVRIREEKERLLEENSSSLNKLNLELNRHIQNGTFSQIDEFGKWVSTVLSMRKEIEQISTWPWRPATLRGFISAILLPLVLFTIQQLMSSLLNF